MKEKLKCETCGVEFVVGDEILKLEKVRNEKGNEVFDHTKYFHVKCLHKGESEQ